MIRELIPWNVLTRTGVPPLKVCRRPLVMGEVTIEVGETLDPELFPMQIRAQRLRQFYEMRRLEPLNAPQDSRQFYLEQLAREQGREAPIAPIQPVASRIVADLPTVAVPVEDDAARPRKPSKGVK